jgi:hypothetical protein
MEHPNKEALIALANDKDVELEYLSLNYGEWFDFKFNASIAADLVFSEKTLFRIKPKEKIVRWQWLKRDKGGSFPVLSSVFYSEKEAEEYLKITTSTIIDKAEWTRMEFDE